MWRYRTEHVDGMEESPLGLLFAKWMVDRFPGGT